jgi:hypothetical protein
MGACAFSTGEQAQEALVAVEHDYRTHAQAARDLARTHFHSADVLAKLVDDIYNE